MTACDGNGAAVGTYNKTDSTTTVNGKEYPVYSMTQATLGTTFYIFVLKYRMGETGAFLALSSGDYNASGDGYSTLGSVAAGSDGLPSSQTWEASSSSATVSWA